MSFEIRLAAKLEKWDLRVWLVLRGRRLFFLGVHIDVVTILPQVYMVIGCLCLLFESIIHALLALFMTCG